MRRNGFDQIFIYFPAYIFLIFQAFTAFTSMHNVNGLDSRGYKSGCSSNLPCDLSKNLICDLDTRLCICAEHNHEDYVFVYDIDLAECVSVLKNQTEEFWACERDFESKIENFRNHGFEHCKSDHECRQNPFSRYEQCNLDKCSCDCSNYDCVTGHEIKLKRGRCQINKKIGESCVRNNECDENAFCTSLNHSVDDTNCQCQDGYVLDSNSSRCIVNQTECTNLEDCTDVYGSNSNCNETLNLCQCINDTFLYQNQCISKLFLNQTCTEDLECEFGIGDDSVCENSICQCRDGFIAINFRHGHRGGECIPIGLGKNEECLVDEQCSLGIWRKCIDFQCGCMNSDSTVEARPIRYDLKKSSCVVLKMINETCEDDSDCMEAQGVDELRFCDHSSTSEDGVGICSVKAESINSTFNEESQMPKSSSGKGNNYQLVAIGVIGFCVCVGILYTGIWYKCIRKPKSNSNVESGVDRGEGMALVAQSGENQSGIDTLDITPPVDEQRMTQHRRI